MSNWQDITPHMVQQLMDRSDVQLIDVRTVDEYLEGHIKGSKLIPLDQLDLRTYEIDSNKQVICICRSGGRSARACDYLTSLGFIDVKNMAGGMLEWQGPVETHIEEA